ncbi:MAG: glycosyltransferase family 4 protein [Pirellulales bacterium]
MRIQILVDCYLPSTKSSAKLVHDLAVEFRRLGHQPCIAAPDDSLAADCTVDRGAGITVLRVKSGKIKGAGRIRRAVNEARLSSTLWTKGRAFFAAHPADLIVFYSPSIFFGHVVARLKRQWACPAYLVLRDIFPQWAVDAGVLRKGLAYWYFRRKERSQYAAADAIGVQSPANLHYFRRPGFDSAHRCEVLYNWTTLDEPDVPTTAFRRRLGLDGKVIFFYGGNIGVAQDMDNVLRLAELLRHERNVHFLLLGDGSEFARLQADIARRSLSNVSLHPAVSQREYLGVLSEIDVGLISLDRRLKTQNLPGKMLGYMYHCRPILASINLGNDLADLLSHHQAGWTCINGDDQAFRDGALQLARNPHLRERLGNNGRRLLEQTFSVERAAQQILARFQTPRRESSLPSHDIPSRVTA